MIYILASLTVITIAYIYIRQFENAVSICDEKGLF